MTSSKRRAMNNVLGFSLLEITIALVLLTVGLVSVLHLFPAGLRAGKRASFANEMTLVAQERIEEVKRIGVRAIEDWLDAVALAEGLGQDPPPAPIEMEGVTGRISWQIMEPEIVDRADLGLAFPNDLRRVAVVVSWQDRGEERQREFATFSNR